MVCFVLFSDEVARAEAFNKRAAEAESLNLDGEKLSIAMQQQVQDSEQEVSAFGAQRSTFLTGTKQRRSDTTLPCRIRHIRIGIVCGTERDRRGGFSGPFVQGLAGLVSITPRTHPDTVARMHSVLTPLVFSRVYRSDVERIKSPARRE